MGGEKMPSFIKTKDGDQVNALPLAITTIMMYSG
jgi:hypothetical protein